jgi:GDP-D-mannose dehydratase
MKNVLLLLKPDIIIHLASISEAEIALNNPLQTMHINGLSMCNICDIIHTYKLHCTVFNASSSEIFKGHLNYTIKDYDTNYNSTHPYGISKIVSQSIVDFYRNTYGYNFSNGILFTTESKHRKSHFLLKKIANYINDFKNGNIYTLKLGNLFSYRNFIHAYDVANSIDHIIRQSDGNNYVICNYSSYLVFDVVKKMFELANINIRIKDTYILDDKNNILIEFSENKRNETNIQGYPQGLLDIGWKPQFNIENIIHDLIC